MSRVGKRPGVSSWSPVAACGDRVGDEDWTAPHFDSTRPICGVGLLGHSLRRTWQYASLGPSRAALHLGLFEQPGQKRVFQQPANAASSRHSPPAPSSPLRPRALGFRDFFPDLASPPPPIPNLRLTPGRPSCEWSGRGVGPAPPAAWRRVENRPALHRVAPPGGGAPDRRRPGRGSSGVGAGPAPGLHGVTQWVPRPALAASPGAAPAVVATRCPSSLRALAGEQGQWL